MIQVKLDKKIIRETFDIIARELFGHIDYNEYLDKRCDQKSGELIYIKDSSKKAKRIMTGDLGELVVCKILNYKVVPDLNVGHTSDFNHPDLKDFGIGVKTVNAPLAHMINRDIDHPQILVTLENGYANIHGIFDPEVLRNNLYDSLVTTKAALKRKSGFNKYHLGQLFNSIEDLTRILERQL